MCRPAETTSGGSAGSVAPAAPGSVSSKWAPVRRSTSAPGRCAIRRGLDEAGEDEAPIGEARAEALDRDADPAAERAEVGAPVARAPELPPVDDQRRLRPSEPQRQGRRQQREERERSAVHGVVAAAMPQEVPEDAGAEADRGPDPPAAGGRVEAAAGGHGDRLEGRLRTLLTPLSPGDEGDRVRVVEPPRQVPVPALRPAERIGEEAVVDDRDLHRAADGTRRPGDT